MEKIKSFIQDKRPTLAKSSVCTYGSILKSLYSKVFKDDDFDLEKFGKDVDKVLEFLKDMPPNRRKTILSALVIITDNKKYRELMLNDVKEYNKEIETQSKTETQKEAWVDGDDIRQVYNELKSNADMLYKKKNLSNQELQQIQNYVLISLLSGIHIPPRRSKDFTEFKIKSVDRDKDNYLDKNKLVFNVYKTAKTYGTQVVELPKELKSILTKWLKVNPTEYLLFDSNLNKLSSVKLNQRLNKIFGKKSSVNSLRHTYLTDKYKTTNEENKKLANDLSAMGTSKEMAINYIKVD
jgi:hypothetical protein